MEASVVDGEPLSSFCVMEPLASRESDGAAEESAGAVLVSLSSAFHEADCLAGDCFAAESVFCSSVIWK